MVLHIWLQLTTTVTFMNSTNSQLFNPQLSSRLLNGTLADTEIPHTLITDNGAQFTSDPFKTFTKTYQFNHITSSPYWSQSNGRAEAAVKSAKHNLLTAEHVDLALLSVRNTPPAGHTFSPAQRLFGRVLRSDLPQLAHTLEPFTPSRDTVVADHIHRKLK